MKNKFKTLFVLTMCLFAIISFFSIPRALAHAETSAKAMCVIDALSGRVLYSKNENQKLPMASTTKIVTALTVLNNCANIDREILIDDRAVGIPGTSIYLKHGEKMTVRELLYGMMLPSGNDSATALAYYVAKDIPAFCALMLKTAQECGAFNSHFDNPHGLDSQNHYTTAKDLALITAKALQNDVFKEIVTTKVKRIKGSAEGTYRYLKNKNRLLNTLEGCIGVKTGYTGKAGRCFVGACERDGFRTVGVILNCGPMFEDCSELLNRAYVEYKQITLLPEYKQIRRIQVEEGKEPFVKTFTKRGFVYPLTKEEVSRVIIKYNMPNVLTAPVNLEQYVGDVQIYLDNCLLFSEKIYTMNSVKKIGVWSSVQDILTQW